MASSSQSAVEDIAVPHEGYLALFGGGLTGTPAAVSVVMSARADETDPDSLALWVEISGVRGNAFGYDMYFQASAQATEGDSVVTVGDLTVIVPSDSVDSLKGATLDFSNEGEGGLVMLNPNTPPVAGVVEIPAGDLSGDFAQRVVAVLAEEINPSIAAHGGRADLVSVDESEGAVYLRLSGGCQGCGMAKATLSQGIELALKESIPEIKSVIDVTDHAVGQNPYY